MWCDVQDKGPEERKLPGNERAAGAVFKLPPSSAPGEDFLRLAAGLAPRADGINARREVACRARAALSHAAERRARWRQFLGTRCGPKTQLQFEPLGACAHAITMSV